MLKYQTNHGFRRGQPVYRATSTSYALATEATGFDGIVGSINSPNQFELVTGGTLDNIAPIIGSASALYLSAAAGVLAPTGTTLVLKTQSADKATVQPPGVAVAPVTSTTATVAGSGITSGANEGGGAPILDTATSTTSTLKFKSVTASGIVTLTDNGTSINIGAISAPSTGVDLQLVYDAAILAEPSLVGYWKLNEPLGSTTLADSKGSNPLSVLAGTIMGFAGPIAGTGDGCLTTDGSSTSGALATGTTGLPTGSSAFSIETWVRCYGDGAGNVVTVYGTSGASYGLLQFKIAQPRIFLEINGGFALVNQAIPDPAWHHLVGTNDGAGHYVLYFDGMPVATTTTTPTSIAAGATVAVAQDLVASGFFYGQVSRYAIYTGVLSAARVRAHYNIAKLGFAP